MRSSSRATSSLACSSSGLSSISPGCAASFIRSNASSRLACVRSRSCFNFCRPPAVSRTGSLRSMPQPIIRPMTRNPDIGDALLIVDPQVDFCPGGALPVPGGDGIFPAVNRASRILPLTVASRDWHPADHVSFQARGGPWPVHCQAGTPGAEFHPDLEADRIVKVFSKGTDPEREAYSAFDDTGLADWL